MTTWAPWIFILLMILVLLKLFVSRSASSKTTSSEISTVKYRFRRRNTLCTTSEMSFLHVLEMAAGGSIRVFSKVHASHILIPRRDLSIDNWNLSFEKVVSKQFDYVLCSADDMTILCVVMLVTQKSIKNPGYRFILKACRSVDLPVINLSAEKEYPPAQVRYLLKKHIPNAFPQDKRHEIPSILKARQAKLKKTKNEADDSLQEMLLREGKRRAQRIEHKKEIKSHTS